MKQKPFSIKFFAFCFMMAPLANLFISGWVNQWPLTGPRGVLEHLSYYERAVLLAFPLVALGIWLVVKWGYYLFIAFSLTILGHNFYMLIESQSYNRYIVLLFQVTTLSVVGFFLQKHITAPYFNPKLKWWESLPRYKVDLMGKVKAGREVFEAEILDISKGGCFVKAGSKLTINQTIAIEFAHKKDEFSAKGVVLWVSEKVKDGYGIKFEQVGVKEKWILQSILKNLRSKKYAEQSGSQVA